MSTQRLTLSAADIELLESAAAEIDSVALDHRMCNSTGPANAPKFDTEHEHQYYKRLKRLALGIYALTARAR